MDFLLGMSPMATAALYVGLLTLQLMQLKGFVSMNRYRHRVASGDYSNPEFARLARVQSNAVEDLPPLMVGLVTLALLNTPAWHIHLAGLVLVVSRILHAIGLASAGGTGWGRLAGTVGTMAVYAAVAAALIFRAFAAA